MRSGRLPLKPISKASRLLPTRLCGDGQVHFHHVPTILKSLRAGAIQMWGLLPALCNSPFNDRRCHQTRYGALTGLACARESLPMGRKRGLVVTALLWGCGSILALAQPAGVTMVTSLHLVVLLHKGLIISPVSARGLSHPLGLCSAQDGDSL